MKLPSGKTLEQMAEVFGDEIDPHEVLGHPDAKEKLEDDGKHIDVSP